MTYNDCDCVPGHRCDCWDYRARPAVPEALDVDAWALAVHKAKTPGRDFGCGWVFDSEANGQRLCPCRGESEAIAREYAALAAKEPTDDR